jgi:tRNA(adenine34) deaminase
MPEPHDAHFMKQALALAARGLEEGSMPIGAVLACESEALAEGYWRGINAGLLDHPEHVVLIEADRLMSFRQRRDATLYTTLEPCLMCMGTAMSFFVGRIVFAMAAPADGAANVIERWQPVLGHPTGVGAYSLPKIEGGVEEAASRSLVTAWLDSGVTGAEADFARRTLA